MLGEWWTSIGWAKQIFWSLAVVASFLLLLWFMLRLFGLELEQDDEKTEKKRLQILEAKSILLFFAFFSWSAFMMLQNNVLIPSLLYAVLIGVLLTLVFRKSGKWFFKLIQKRSMDLQKVKESTGEVLVSIPPHRNGFGKVHLKVRGVPNELEAMTAGQAIQPGMSVRVVDIIDEKVLVVEPVNKAPNLTKKDKIR